MSQQAEAAMMPTPATAYDTALARLHAHGPSLRNGLFNHAPMVVEALTVLGEAPRIAGWLDAEAGDFTPRPTAIEPIASDAWAGALGRPDRFEDWARFFRDAIARDGWRSTLEPWAARLAPGLTTAACHGFLRTAHAVRALGRVDLPIRRDELAEGLAAWAALFSRLPVPFDAAHGEADPQRALDALTPVPREHRPGPGLITAGYDALRHAPQFSRQVAAVDLSGDVLDRIDDCAVGFARLFLDSVDAGFEAIVFTHAVTTAAAVRHFAGVVRPDTLQLLLARAWEAGCALKAAFGGDFVAARAAAAVSSAGDAEALASAAAAHGDDHVIKLTEACRTTYARRADEVLLEVPRRAMAVIEARPGTAS